MEIIILEIYVFVVLSIHDGSLFSPRIDENYSNRRSLNRAERLQGPDWGLTLHGSGYSSSNVFEYLSL